MGRRLGRRLAGRHVLLLSGDLGSGKTTFTRGLAAGAGFKGRVSSPTFVLAKIYRGGRVRLHHLDLYRVARCAPGDVGIEDCLLDGEAACVIEWPEAGEAYYPSDRLEIRFSHGKSEGERRVSLSARGPRSRSLLKGLA